MGYRGCGDGTPRRRRRHGALLVSPGGLVALVVLVVLAVSHPDRVAADLMSDIQQGLQTTGKLFGINTIADVADLVAKGFATRRGGSYGAAASQATDPTRTGEDSGSSSSSGGGPASGIGSGLTAAQAPSMMMAMLKLLGLDGGQLGAMLINSIIFLAHVIGSNLGAFRQPLDPSQQAAAPPSSSFLAREPPPAAYDRPLDGPPSRHPPGASVSSGTTPDSNSSSSTTSSTASSSGFNPLEWILRNPSKRFRVLLEQVQGTDLTEHLERELEHLNQYGPADTDCIRLLMCKIKPFVRKMQHVVRDQIVPPAATTTDKPAPAQHSTTPGPPSGGEILDGIYHNLPTADEFLQQSEYCDQQFRHCARELRKQ